MGRKRSFVDEEEVKWVGSHYEENVSKIDGLKSRSVLFYRYEKIIFQIHKKKVNSCLFQEMLRWELNYSSGRLCFDPEPRIC